MAGDAYAGTGNTASVTAGRLSYLLGLSGPSLAVDTACSSSLVATHLACQALRNRECDAALAGGVNLMLTPTVTMNFCKARMLSADGSCKTFDAAANGYVRGEGIGVVVLKRLSDALADNDPILAVVRATAINQDGRSSGLTVPNGPAQKALILEALASAGLEPSDLDYIEAHGTGTALGDPIELEALGSVFSKTRKGAEPLWIGSVKTNIGHLEAAAGVTGLIKLVLALRHEEIPPHLHFQQPTPHVDWTKNSMRVPRDAVAWPAGDRQRLAGVSSFGFSGTNAHVILEEAPRRERPAPAWERPRHLLVLSAKSAAALDEMIDSHVRHLNQHDELDLGDVCHTAAVGRSKFDHRVAISAASRKEAVRGLKRVRSAKQEPGAVRREQAGTASARVAFLFTGQGAQYVGMGRELYESQPVFRRSLDRCDAILREHMDRPLLSVIYPSAGETSPLNETAYTQPALFAIAYALAQMWISWGIKPAWVMGHSIGEFVAACIAGVFSLEDGLKLIAARGRLMQQLPAGGAMVAIGLPESRVRPAIAGLEDKVSIAALNGPRQVVVSGDEEVLRAVVSKLGADDIRVTWLQVSHAFHSPLMDPVLPEFSEICEQVTYKRPRMRFVSTVTGGFVKDEITTAKYWRDQIRAPVNFAASMKCLVDDEARILLEVGPKPILIGLGQQSVDEPDAAWLPSLKDGRSDWEQVLESVAELFVRGAPVDFESFDRGCARQKVSLPTYPFQRQRFWVDTSAEATSADTAGPVAVSGSLDEASARNLAEELASSDDFSAEERELLPRVLLALSEQQKEGKKEDPLRNAYFEIEWEDGPLDEADDDVPMAARTWLVLADDGGIGASVAGLLEAQGHACIVTRVDGGEAALDYDDLLQQASGNEAMPLGGILHFKNLDAPAFDATPSAEGSAFLRGATGSLLQSLQALLRLEETANAKVWAVTQGGQATGKSSSPANPAQSPAWGLAKVISLEHSENWGGIVDLDQATPQEQAALVREILAGDAEDQLALHGGRRLVPRLTRNHPGTGKALDLSDDASYLITGGLGGLGLSVAQWLIDRGARHLVLSSRSGAATPEAQQAVKDLEDAGADVRVIKADVSDAKSVDSLFDEIESSGHELKGVIHAAGVSGVAAVKEMTVDQFEDVLQGKVLGAWNIHRRIADQPLDFFVLFSSIASVWGSAGQAHYAAANQFLDSLAHYRRANGAVATSVNWGPWIGSGIATAEARAWLSRIGVAGLSPKLAVQALQTCLETRTWCRRPLPLSSGGSSRRSTKHARAARSSSGLRRWSMPVWWWGRSPRS